MRSGRDEFFRESLHQIRVGGRRPANANPNVAAIRPPELVKSVPECRDITLCLRVALGKAHQHADPPHFIGLLRPRRERPCQRAAEERDKRAAGHSITSSARASNVGGTLRPSALATLRLIANSNLVGACTGRSAALAPPRMRSTYSAARGNVSPKSTPYETKPPSRAMNRNGYTAGSRWRAASAKIMLRCT